MVGAAVTLAEVALRDRARRAAAAPDQGAGREDPPRGVDAEEPVA